MAASGMSLTPSLTPSLQTSSAAKPRRKNVKMAVTAMAHMLASMLGLPLEIAVTVLLSIGYDWSYTYTGFVAWSFYFSTALLGGFGAHRNNRSLIIAYLIMGVITIIAAITAFAMQIAVINEATSRKTYYEENGSGSCIDAIGPMITLCLVHGFEVVVAITGAIFCCRWLSFMCDCCMEDWDDRVALEQAEHSLHVEESDQHQHDGQGPSTLPPAYDTIFTAGATSSSQPSSLSPPIILNSNSPSFQNATAAAGAEAGGAAAGSDFRQNVIALVEEKKVPMTEELDTIDNLQ